MSKKKNRIFRSSLPSVASIILVISTMMLLLVVPEEPSLHAQIEQAPLSFNNKSSNHTLQEFFVPIGSHPHDVAPSADGSSIWYTAQALGQLGQLDPKTGKIHSITLGKGSAPHGVIVGPDRAPWITDGGLNAIVRVDPVTEKVRVFSLPAGSNYANLNTATFDHTGVLWFTGQSGIYGRLDPVVGKVQIFKAPGGPGPCGITTTPEGSIYYASLAGNYIARIDLKTHTSTVIQPPTTDQGARRIWSDSHGRLWITEWNAGKLALYDPATDKWKDWKLPGSNPKQSICCICG
jgi:virginiamycin B lyase